MLVFSQPLFQISAKDLNDPRVQTQPPFFQFHLDAGGFKYRLPGILVPGQVLFKMHPGDQHKGGEAHPGITAVHHLPNNGIPIGIAIFHHAHMHLGAVLLPEHGLQCGIAAHITPQKQ
jgi:hypothetical protein